MSNKIKGPINLVDLDTMDTLTVSLDENNIATSIDCSDADISINDTITLTGEIPEDGKPRPNHYSQDPNSLECIEVIKQLCKEHQNDPFTDYNRYQAFKYLWRLGKKDDVLFDLNKAITFLTFARDALEEERNG